MTEYVIPTVGSKVRVGMERQRYTVQAANDRFAICTKPFNPRKTVLYFILDKEQGLRGPENLVLGLGAETVEQCEAMLERVSTGETEVSHRRCVPWDVVEVIPPK